MAIGEASLISFRDTSGHHRPPPPTPPPEYDLQEAERKINQNHESRSISYSSVAGLLLAE